MTSNGLRDALGVVTHPRPGLVTVPTAAFDQRIVLSRVERDHLSRIAVHLEAGKRLRFDEHVVVAEVDPTGKIDRPTPRRCPKAPRCGRRSSKDA